MPGFIIETDDDSKFRPRDVYSETKSEIDARVSRKAGRDDEQGSVGGGGMRIKGSGDDRVSPEVGLLIDELWFCSFNSPPEV